MADENMWKAFAEIGIEAIHTGPVKRAGGISGWTLTPECGRPLRSHQHRRSIPRSAPRTSSVQMCGTANWYGGTIIDDIVPGHTGKGADFRLAEMKYADYPGIYHMVEIDPRDWHYLPDVPARRGFGQHRRGHRRVAGQSGLHHRTAATGHLLRRGRQGDELECHSARASALDGVERRWVYLHYFKDGQPSINWLDPSFAGMRLVIGDALHSLADLGTGGLRLDANGFLGAEKTAAEDSTAWSEGHPLSEAANHLIASMVRKVGGFTFQELNLTIDDIREIGEVGADLSYDFINRPAYHHALATADTEFLRLTLRTTLELGVDPASLVHALQNHDELTYELVHWSTGHRDDVYTYKGEEITGEAARRDGSRPTSPSSSPVRTRPTTWSSPPTASLAPLPRSSPRRSASTISTPIEDIDRIRRAHLLLAMFNALQPGVFALSGWDLCGMLTLPAAEVAELLRGGDTRWIHRAAHDLMGVNPDGDTVDGRNAAWAKPLRLDPRTARGRHQLRCVSYRQSSGCARITASQPVSRSTSLTCPTAECL